MNTSHGAEETKILIEERVRTTNERLITDFCRNGTKIHRFPRSLRRMGGKDGYYVTPSVAAFGPYHHRSAHLQEMEEVKHAAAHYLCAKSGNSVGDVYRKVLSIAGEARRCYPEDDFAVADFSADDFAAMMFLDGCFLLYYMSLDEESALLVNRSIQSTGPSMARDIFLLENQLPWLVLQTLMTFTNIHPVFSFIAGTASNLLHSSPISDKRLPEDEFNKHRPPHLLGLLRHYLIGSMPPPDTSYSKIKVHYALASSAIELAEMGMTLKASNKRWFADMCVRKGPLAGELSLTPFFLNDYTACWLVNMAAFEACMSTAFHFDGLTINSYISLLAMLVDKEEDVHELRAKRLVHSNSFSNQEILVFFKGLARHLKLSYRYLVIVEKIEEYKRERPARIVVHKFFYNHFKAIAAVLSIAGVIVGIFRALLSVRSITGASTYAGS